MTTIAVNKTMMAGDRRYTKDGLILVGRTKIFEIPGAVLGVKRLFVGFSGLAREIGPALIWLNDTSAKPPRLSNLEAVALTDKGVIYHSDSLTDWIEIKQEYYSIGSGHAVALGAMGAGKDPFEAVKIAAKYDAGTGSGFTKLIME